MSIQLVVLKTGEQILCEVEEAGKNKILLKKPAVLVPAGDKGIGLAPWMPYTKASAGVTLRDDAVSLMNFATITRVRLLVGLLFHNKTKLLLQSCNWLKVNHKERNQVSVGGLD